jgi:TRAP-type C4-dicarboxylate transport system permease small subunit
MLVTVADILLRLASRLVALVTGSNPGLALVGIVDLVQLSVMTAAFLAIPYAFLRGAQVMVDLLPARLPRAVPLALDLAAALLALLLVALMLQHGVAQARMQVAFGDRSATLGIGIVWYWLPLLVGLGCSLIALLVVAAAKLGQLLGPRA